MQSQLQRLSWDTDGRYATDEELQFISHYAQSFGLRCLTYQRIQVTEAVIVQQVYAKMRALDPNLFLSANEDVSAKWKRDTLRVLRYSAVALLLDDPGALRERLLVWMQSVMRAFGAQRSCGITYQVMQEIVRQQLPPDQAALFCPILELNRQFLGVK